MTLSIGERSLWATEYVRARQVRLEALTAEERYDHDKAYEKAIFDATEDAWEVLFELHEMLDRLRRTGRETSDGGDVMIRDMLGDNTYKEFES